jgi:hypothetical protein
MSEKVQFQTNIPVEVALKYSRRQRGDRTI